MLLKLTLCRGEQSGLVICITGLGYAGPSHSDLGLKQKSGVKKRGHSIQFVRNYEHISQQIVSLNPFKI